jgi:hypothetical protein
MPETEGEALGLALALTCLSKRRTTFGGNNLKHRAAQPGLDGVMLANHEKSGHRDSLL